MTNPNQLPDPLSTARARLDNFVRQRGHGAINEVAVAVGTTRSYVSSFRSGNKIGSVMAEKIDAYVLQQADATNKPPTVQRFRDSDPALILAEELDTLAATLRSPVLDSSYKGDRFFTTICSMFEHMDDLRAMFEEYGKRGKRRG